MEIRMAADPDLIAGELDARLAASDGALAASFPGERGTRQPVHTVYVPGDRYDGGTVASWGRRAREALERHAR
ncbi:aldolase, partial [Saccharomonospora xinjiangensis]|uniref:DUF6986 family protein n=1 Tax=Saccharomonospora xinjiangensis TaxID=75294 RepID=UPI0035980E61